MKPIYLDYNATTPVDPEVSRAMRPYLEEHFGNPSSAHWYGAQTKKALERARRQVSALLGCESEEIVFTSGGSEANNYAIRGVAAACRERGDHIITSSVEHPAVLQVCDYLEQHGFRVTRLPVDRYGLVDIRELEQAVTPETILITIMHANNEVGTLQPITEISKLARAHGILLHTDAAQSVGKIPANVQRLGVDLLSLAGHKFYAPKGVGALYVRGGVHLEKLIYGADHELNRRAGTENVLELVGLGQACEIAARDLGKNLQHLRDMRERLLEGLLARFDDLVLHGHPEKRLPNTLSVSFPGIEANTLLSEVTGVAASAGAACHADSIDISPVLQAMGVPEEVAMGTIRLSVGRMTTPEQVDRAVELITDAVERLRPSEGVTTPTGAVKERKIKLTHYTHGLGCACKLRPQILEKILQKLSKSTDEKVLVGPEKADDAAVYRLDKKTALVETVDFFTPVVDDPYDFGAIAAANAFSDIYAMGAKPLFALNIVGFPSSRLSINVLERILEGAQQKAVEAGVSIIGGHTVEDTEPKYGLAVTGVVHPSKILTNSGAQPGDAIILTKPIGTGILTTALKRGLLEEESTELLVRVMATLNRAAAEVQSEFPVTACTDVTGFGLLGHLREMTCGSGVNARIKASSVPLLPGAREQAAANVVPGGTLDNLAYVWHAVEWESSISQTLRILLCDAQTSGGLLIAIAPDSKGDLLAQLNEAKVTDAVCIGEFTEPGEGRISVVP